MVRLVQLEIYIVFKRLVIMAINGLPVVQIHTSKSSQIIDTDAAIVSQHTVIINVWLTCITQILVLFPLTANVPLVTLCLQKVFLYLHGATVQMAKIVVGTKNV